MRGWYGGKNQGNLIGEKSRLKGQGILAAISWRYILKRVGNNRILSKFCETPLVEDGVSLCKKSHLEPFKQYPLLRRKGHGTKFLGFAKIGY